MSTSRRNLPTLCLVVSACALLAVCGASAARGEDATRRGAAEDTLHAVVQRWADAVGGWDSLARVGGTHLHAHTISGDVPGTAEAWVTGRAYREVVRERDDRSERVRKDGMCWLRDWNGKSRALAGRDLADQVTEALLRSLVYAGFSHQTLASAGARDAGDDSTHAYRVVGLAPAGGSPCELYLDKTSGRPARAERWPYGERLVLAFEDWRPVDGVSVPFRLREFGVDGVADTSVVDDATVERGRARWPFDRPSDGPSDVRFSEGTTAVSVPFNFENDHIMVECRVDGSPPLWFMFDTGADVSVINRGRLAELGLAAFSASSTTGGGNAADVAFTRVARLEIGGVALLNQRNGVLDLAGLERIYGMRLGGILGYDFASRFVLVVDYDAHTMTLHAPGEVAGVTRGQKVSFVLERGHPHVRGEIAVDDGARIPADFIIDSGAAESANLTAPFVREHHLLERARKTPAGALNVMAGSEKQFFAQTSVRGRLRSIRIGGVEVTGVPVNLQQGTSGAYASASFSGTIGQRILQRFTTTYDYPHSAIYLAPNAEAAKPFTPRTTFGLSLLSDGPDYTTFTVSGVREDSPAASAGFKKGDVIASMDDRPATQWRLAGLRAALAQDGSRHTVEVRRGDSDRVRLTFSVSLVSIEDR